VKTTIIDLGSAEPISARWQVWVGTVEKVDLRTDDLGPDKYGAG